VEAPLPQGVLKPCAFESAKHTDCPLFHIRTQVKKPPRGEEGEEHPRKRGLEDGAFFVGGFPPGVRKLEVDGSQGARGKEPGDIEAGIQLQDLEVLEFALLGAEAGFAGKFFAPLEGNVGDMGVGFAIGEGEAAQAAADFQLKGPLEAKDARPVQGRLNVGKFQSSWLWTQGDT